MSARRHYRERNVDNVPPPPRSYAAKASRVRPRSNLNRQASQNATRTAALSSFAQQFRLQRRLPLPMPRPAPDLRTQAQSQRIRGDLTTDYPGRLSLDDIEIEDLPVGIDDGDEDSQIIDLGDSSGDENERLPSISEWAPSDEEVTANNEAEPDASSDTPAPVPPGKPVDLSELAPVQPPISDFEMALGIWLDTESISRRAYASLRSILQIATLDDLKQLPVAKSVIQQRFRTGIPMIPLSSKTIVVDSSQQTTGKEPEAVRQAHFFDPRLVVAALCSAKDGPPIHHGMAELVDTPSEYWHSRAWGSSIRLVGGDFAYDSEGEILLPSDIVQYHLQSGNELPLSAPSVTGQITWIGRDKRPSSASYGHVIAFICQIIRYHQLRCNKSSNHLLHEPQPNDLILLDKTSDLIRVSSVLQRRPDVSIFRPSHHETQQTPFCITLAYSDQAGLRDIKRCIPVRGELEVLHYGRKELINKLREEPIGLPLLMFIDEFGLYRNTYRSLTGVYIMAAGLSVEERQKRVNACTFTLGRHGASLDETINVVKEGLYELENGFTCMVNGKLSTVFAPLMAVLGDMKGQLACAGLKGPRASSCCRYCDATPDTRGNLLRNFERHGKFHFEILAIRESLAGKSKRDVDVICQRSGILPEQSQLLKIIPTLDCIMSFPPDVPHSEFLGMIRNNLYPMVYNNLFLTTAAQRSLTKEFQSFPLPPHWGRIQSPARHMQSWSLSESGKASIVMPICLRRWLKSTHIQPWFKQALRAVAPVDSRPNSAKTDTDFVVHCFATVAMSNSVLSSPALDTEQAKNLSSTVIRARKSIEIMLRTLTQAETHRTGPGARQSRSNLRPRNEGFIPERNNVDAAISDQESVGDDDSSDRSVRSSLPPTSGPSAAADNIDHTEVPGKVTLLPNYHQGAHFDLARQEYATPWNCNGLWGEDKHREYKYHVQYTNHIAPEPDIMLKDGILSSLRLIYHGVFRGSCPVVTSQLERLQLQCPDLLHPVLSVEDKYRSVEANQASHRHIVLRKPQTRNGCARLGIQSSLVASSDAFKRLFCDALRACSINDTLIKDSQIAWYFQCSFSVPFSTRRRTIYVGKFAKFDGGVIGKIRGVFSYSDKARRVQQIFVWIQAMEKLEQSDQALSLPIVALSDTFFVVPIQSINEEFAYLIPLSSDEDTGTYIHCTWSVKYL